MFPLIETIKVVDGKLQHLKWHQNRFEASYFKYYKQLTNIKLEKVIRVPEEHSKGVVKLRFLYNATDCFCQFDVYEHRKIDSFKIIRQDDIEYALKLVDRKIFDQLCANSNADEIVIVKNNRVTDTSFSNIVFFDGTHWVTPKYPLLYGTTRARMLFENKIIQKDFLIEDLSNFQSFKLINAMLEENSETYPIGFLL